VESTNQSYLYPEPQSSSVTTLEPQRAFGRASETSALRVLLHLALLIVTAVTTMLTGAAMYVGWESEMTLFGPVFQPLTRAIQGDFIPLANGLLFAFALLSILGAHELGHYFACRHYGIRATLPFFIPAPPVVTPFGTFGAVIKIKEPIRSRRALFDIGIAGPLAGFAFALPASVVGLFFAEAAPPIDPSAHLLIYQDPPLFQLINHFLGVPPVIGWNPVYWASWGALLVTALNLFPVGQLDGGHALYAIFGRGVHRWVSMITCAAVAALAVASWLLHSSPIWFLWAAVLLFLLRAGHPPVIEQEPLGKGRVVLAVVSLIVFLLCFMPFPIILT
jgi:membrane-associated protease RseP (regulator of RpoE activity)